MWYGSIGGLIYTELEKEKRISEEFNRISIYFEKLDENERAVIVPLIQNAAFMRVTLEDLQEIIAEQGPVEAYQNGANQSGMKQSAALQSYNSTVKNYAAVIKTLFGLLPPMERTAALSYTKPRAKTEEEREEERRQMEERQKRINAEQEAAIAYQQWQREQEASGHKVTISFSEYQRRQREKEAGRS